MKRTVVCLLLSLIAAYAQAAGAEDRPAENERSLNLAVNPSFEEVGAGGVPVGWQTSGNPRNVSQTLSTDKGRDGKRCARLACTQFTPGRADAHAMLCQMGIPVTRGKNYRVAFWARGEKIAADAVSVALSDTAGWQPCGLQDMFIPTAQWARYEFTFRAVRDCGKASRFQIWFTSAGTLWLDDVVFEETRGPAVRPGNVVPAKGNANLVPNASFECGADGWGSAEWDHRTHWGGPMNALFGQIDRREHHHGQASLRIDLSPENQPVCYFDYYELYRVPILAPLAANEGWIEVEPGREYTLSVWMKAKSPGTPARLAVRQFQSGSFDRAVTVSDAWERFSMTFKPAARWCCVLAGPDLRKTRESPAPPDRATLWLDAVQLEPGRAPSAFVCRQPVELGVSTDRPGNVVQEDETLTLSLAAANADRKARQVRLDYRFTDFFDREVARETVALDVPAGECGVHAPVYSPGRCFAEHAQGFFRLHVRMESGDAAGQRTVRLAIVPKPREGDSRFGVNHAYPWPHLLDLSRKAGLVWVRDWSLKWQEVEPEKGRFNFTETDYQIDRPLRHGLRVLGLLPFPSSNWASSAPASVGGKGGYPQNRARVAYAPRDAAEFENYVAKTVAHYQDRIRWWQVFNEPLFTDYSLPRAHGYDGADYGRLAQTFSKAARRADPSCKILAGIGGLSEGQILEDFEKFFAAGGLAAADAIDFHHYPGIRPPEFLEGLLEKLGALMEKHGGRKPIWCTEYGYYADDDPWAEPLPHQGFDRPLASERLQAEYAVRWAVLCLANGVDKVFYHAGTCGGINSDSLEGVFYKYGGRPKKIYAAQAAMAGLLPPESQFVRRLPLGEGVRGYLFRNGPQFVAVVWAPHGPASKPIRAAAEGVQLLDLMARPLASKELVPNGAPIYVTGPWSRVGQVFNLP